MTRNPSNAGAPRKCPLAIPFVLVHSIYNLALTEFLGASEQGQGTFFAITPDVFACRILRERPSNGHASLLEAPDIALDIPGVRKYPASARFGAHKMSTVAMS